MTNDPGATDQTWPSGPVSWSTTAGPSEQPRGSDPAAVRIPATTLAPEPRPVGPALPIIITVAWLLLAAASGLASMFSFLLFDPGVEAVSVWTWMKFFGFWGTLLLCPASVLLSWIVWAVTRRRLPTGWGRVLRGTCYALPLVGVLTTAIGFAGAEVWCGGSLTCP